MRIAVISDIHGNYHALRACLSHAIGHGATTFWFLDVTRVPSHVMQQGGTRLREDSLLPRRCLREAHFMQRLPVSSKKAQIH